MHKDCLWQLFVSSGSVRANSLPLSATQARFPHVKARAMHADRVALIFQVREAGVRELAFASSARKASVLHASFGSHSASFGNGESAVLLLWVKTS